MGFRKTKKVCNIQLKQILQILFLLSVLKIESDIYFFKISRAKFTYVVDTMHLDTKKAVSKYRQQWKVMQPNERL